MQLSQSEEKILQQMLRVHHFLNHKEIVFHDLRTFNIEVNTADMISRYLQSNIDLPDAIRKMEEIAIEEGYYSDFLRKYVSEEYSVQEEYSFTVIALLHYYVGNAVSLDDAITELITLSSNKIICIECCSMGELDEDEKRELVKSHNYALLCQEVDGADIISDAESLSDASNSTNDPNYNPNESTDSSSKDATDEEPFSPLLSEFKGYNPFDTSDEEEEDSGDKYPLNSTVAFNPFHEGDSDTDKEHLAEISETPSSKKAIECQFCQKVFSNRFNMKLHLIGLVIS